MASESKDARDDGAYGVLARRMAEAAKELARRAEELNTHRTETFGGSCLTLSATPRLGSPRPRAVRDLVQVGGLLLAGGAPPPGTDGDPGVEDVLTLHRRHGDDLEAVSGDAVPGLLDDPRFRQDFGELYRYYRGARLLRLRRTDSSLLAVFRTGEGPGDIRVLRWRTPDGGAPQYLDARGERDEVAPPPHDVTWTAAGRDAHVPGRHPHVAVDGVLFVSTEGGELTVKTENDTGTPHGVWSEPVEEPQDRKSVV